MPPSSLKTRAKQWLLVGGPGDGLTQWHHAGLSTVSVADAKDPSRLHYYVGRQIEIDGETYPRLAFTRTSSTTSNWSP